MSRKLFLLITCLTPGLITADVPLDVFFNEVQSLSELPMSKLIHIKSTFADQEDAPETPESVATLSKEGRTSPIALPLRRNGSKGVRRHDDYWQDDKGKGSKISKIFQLAITALSFFAFGGYLLTLIITALRRNAVATSTGNVIFLQGLQTIRRPKRKAAFLDPMENDFNTERLYRGMIMLSEGYALYN